MAYSNSKLVTYTRLCSDKTARCHNIDTITIHCYVGQVTAKQGCDYFATTSRSVSSNYVVGYDGSIGLSVEEKYRAWTSGGTDSKGRPIRVNGISGKDNDHRAVTIEVACESKAPYTVTDAAMKSLIKLVADICQRNKIKRLMWKNDKSLVGKITQQNMTVHQWFANTACPGSYLMNKMSYIATAVNEIIVPKATTTTKPVTTTVANKLNVKCPYTKPAGTVMKGDTGTGVKWVQWHLWQLGYLKNSGEVDGDFGSKTLAAVKKFQKAKKLTVDGYAGTQTNYNLDLMAGNYVVIITKTTTVRKNASATAKKNGTVAKGGAYTITAEYKGWGKLKSGAGWIKLKDTKVKK